MKTFWAILKNINFQVEVTVADFWAPFCKIWDTFISTSGHAACVTYLCSKNENRFQGICVSVNQVKKGSKWI